MTGMFFIQHPTKKADIHATLKYLYNFPTSDLPLKNDNRTNLSMIVIACFHENSNYKVFCL